MARKVTAFLVAYSCFATSVWSFAQPIPGVAFNQSAAWLGWSVVKNPLEHLARAAAAGRAYAASSATQDPVRRTVYNNFAELNALSAADDNQAPSNCTVHSAQPSGDDGEDDDQRRDEHRSYQHHNYKYGNDDDSHGPATPIVPTGVTIFGPQTYTRTTGPTDDFTSTITVPAWDAQPFYLHVVNGDAAGNHRVSSASIRINGTMILGESVFNQRVASVDCAIQLTAQSTLQVDLDSKPGSFLTITALAKSLDHTPPVVTIVSPGAAINTPQPHLDIRYQDLVGSGETVASGVNTTTLHVLLDGVDRTSLFTRRADEATADLPASLALAPGVHTISASIQDNAENLGQASEQFQMNTTPPVLQIVQPAAGSYLNTTTPQIVLAYSSSVGLNLASLKVTDNGTDITSAFTKTATGATGTAPPLTQGGNTIVATISDQAGNQTTTSLVFNVDTIAPLISIVHPASGSRHGSASVEYLIQYSDDQAIDPTTLVVTVDGSPLAVTPTLTSVSGTVTLADAASHVITASIKDKAGNPATTASTFSVDTSLPNVHIIQPVTSAILNNATPPFQVTYSESSSGVDTSTFKATVDGTDVTGLFTVGAASASANLQTPLNDGSHTFFAQIASSVGNVGHDTNQVLIDTVKPQVTIISPPGIVNTRTPAASVQYSDSGSGIDPTSAHITLDGVDVTGSFGVSASSATGTLGSGTGLSEGSHQLAASVADKAGNTAQPSASFLVDVTPPTAAFSTPASDSFINNPQPTITLTYSDSGSGVDQSSIHIFLQQGTAAQTEVTPLFTFSSGQATTTIPASSPLAPATYHLRAVVADRAGNQTPVSSAFVLDTVAPTYTIQTPAANAFLNTATPTFTVVYQDDSSGVDTSKFALRVDGVDRTNRLAVTDNGATGALQAGDALADGSHQVAVTVVDRAGNSAPVVPQSFLVDTVPPVINIGAPLAASITNNNHPSISVTYSDGGSGIDVTTFQLLIDGVDHTTEFATTAAGATGSPAAALLDGSHTVSATIKDLAGNPATATTGFTIDTVPPVITATAAPPPNAAGWNTTDVTVSFTCSDSGSGVVQCPPSRIVSTEGKAQVITGSVSDVAGNTATASVTLNIEKGAPTITASLNPAANAAGWNNSDVTVSFQCTPSASDIVTCQAPVTISTEGKNQHVSGSVTDQAGKAATTSATVNLDKTAPVITANAAPPPNAAGWNNTDVIVSYTCSDALSGVALCPSPATVSSEGAHQNITAQATDQAGNTTAVATVLNIDKTPPTITATATPAPNGAGWNNSNVTVTFSCSDNLSGVASCPGQQLAITEGQGQNFSGQATDVAGNTATGSISLSIDKTPPTIVQISTPDHVSKLHSGQISVTVNDNFTVAQVVISVNGTSLGTFTTPPYQANLQVPTSSNPGDTLTVTVVATDQAGNSQTASRGVSVAADGVIVGQVLSDATGLPVQGASVQVISASGQSDQTDDRGRYSFPASDVHLFLSATNPGGTTVEREIFVQPGAGTVAVDARITPLAPPAPVGSLGGTLKAGSIAIAVPAASVPDGTNFQLTPLSGQGLPGLLPLGWSPLAAFDLRASTAAANLPTAISGLPNVIAHLVSYNPSLHAWTMVTPNVQTAGGTATFTVPATGAYALVVPDAVTPPVAVPDVGGPLTGIAVQALDPAAASSGSLNPAVLPAGGGTATATLGVQSPTFVPSGTVIQANLSERFSLASGDVVSEQTRSEDIVLYNALAPANSSMGARFPVTPSHQYTNTQLLTGKVHLDILAGREGARGQPGGNDPLTLSDGLAIISVPGGALSQDTAISVQTTPLEDFVPVSSTLSALQEVLVDFSGEILNTPAQLSIPAAGLDSTHTFLLTQVQRIRGVPHIVTVAVAQVIGANLTSVASPGLPGVIRGGEYVFYDISAPSGFVKGVVSSAAGTVQALVQTDSLPIASITGTDGRYIVPALAGTVNLRANAPNTTLSGTASVQLTAGQTAIADIQLAGSVNTAVVAPADGSLGVPTSTIITVTTTTPLNPASIAQSNLVVFKGTPSNPGALVPIQPFVLSVSGTVLTFAPVNNLDPASQYTVQVSGLADSLGGAVVVPTSSFTTKAAAALTFDPSRITFGFPDQNGIIHVSAPAGSLPPGTTVMIVDQSNAVVLTLTVFPDGSLSGDFPGTINDVLQVSVTDPNGATTSFTRSQFTAPDGSVAVGPGGGTVTGTGGVELRIPNGAFDKGVTFKIEAFGPDLFTDRPPLDGANFGGGLKITVNQVPTFNSEVKVAFAKPADAPDGAFYYVYRRLLGPNGLVLYETLDHAFVEGQGANAKVVTASPPFGGYSSGYGTVDVSFSGGLVLGGALITTLVLAWTINPAGPGIALPGVVTGKVLRASIDKNGQPVFKGVPGIMVNAADSRGVPIINLGGGTSQADGTFTLWAPFFHGGSTVAIVACDVVVNSTNPPCHTATASEITVADTVSVNTFQVGPLLKFYKNIAAGNITFPPLPPQAPPPQLSLSIAARTGSGTTPVNGLVLVNTPLVITAKSNSTDPSQVPSVTGAVQGQPYSVSPDSSDPTLFDFTPDFTPSLPGVYTVTAQAISPLGGNPVKAQITFLAIAAGGSNDAVINDKPPDVLTAQLVPKANATNVPTTVLPQVVFSEPVNNVASSTFLYETDASGTANNAQVPIKISGVGVVFDAQGNSSDVALDTVHDSDNATTITIQPLEGLKFGTFYKISLGPAISDLDKDANGKPAPKNLVGTPPAREFLFQTYGLTDLSQTDSFASPRIAVVNNRAYATTPVNVSSQLLEYDVSDPTHPVPVNVGQLILGRAADLAGEEGFALTSPTVNNANSSIGLLAVATGVGALPLPSNIFFYDVSDGNNVQRIGAVSVTGSAGQEGTILRMVLKDNFAYTSTFQKGIQVVDINHAIQNYTTAVQTDIRSFGVQVTTDGAGFGRDAVVNTIPVMTDKFHDASGNPEHVPATLFDLKARDLQLDQQTQTLVVATGIEALVIVDPVAGQVISQLSTLQVPPTETIDRGNYVDAGTIPSPCPGQIGTTTCNVAVITGGTQLVVVDLTDPRHPQPFSFFNLPDFATDVILKDNMALVGQPTKTLIVDLTDPARPELLGSIDGVGGRLTLNGFLYSTSFGPLTGLNIASLGALAYVKSFEPKFIVVSPSGEVFDNVRINYATIPPDPSITKAEVHIDASNGGRTATLSGSVSAGSGSVLWQSGTVVASSLVYVATVHAAANGAELPTTPVKVPFVRVPIAVSPRDRMVRIQFALPDQQLFVDSQGNVIDKYTVKVFLNNDGSGNPAFTVKSSDIANAYVSDGAWFSTTPDGTGGDIQDGSNQGTSPWVTRKIDGFAKAAGLNNPVRMQAFEIGTVLALPSAIFVSVVSEKTGKEVQHLVAATSSDGDWAQVIDKVAGYVDENPTPTQVGIPGVFDNSSMIFRVLHTLDQASQQFGIGVLQGLLDGFKDGAEGDINLVGSIFDAVFHPVKTAIALYQFVVKIIKAIGQISIVQVIQSMYSAAGSISWPTLDQTVMLAQKGGYFLGYICGFIIEQVLSAVILALVGAGVAAIAEKVLAFLRGFAWIGELVSKAAALVRVLGYWLEVLAKAGADSKAAKAVVGFLRDSQEAIAALADKYPAADKVIKALATTWETSAKLASKALEWLSVINKMQDAAAERFVNFVLARGEQESEVLVGSWLAKTNGKRSIQHAAEDYDGFAKLPGGAADGWVSAAETVNTDTVRFTKPYADKYKFASDGDRVGSSMGQMRQFAGDTRYTDEAVGDAVKLNSDPAVVEMSNDAIEETAAVESHVPCTKTASLAFAIPVVDPCGKGVVQDWYQAFGADAADMGPQLQKALKDLKDLNDTDLETKISRIANSARINPDARASVVRALATDGLSTPQKAEYFRSLDRMQVNGQFIPGSLEAFPTSGSSANITNVGTKTGGGNILGHAYEPPAMVRMIDGPVEEFDSATQQWTQVKLNIKETDINGMGVRLDVSDLVSRETIEKDFDVLNGISVDMKHSINGTPGLDAVQLAAVEAAIKDGRLPGAWYVGAGRFSGSVTTGDIGSVAAANARIRAVLGQDTPNIIRIFNAGPF